MKKANVEPQLAQPGTYRKVFRDGETVLLTVTQRWPRLAGDSPGLRRIDRYYDALAERWRKRWEGPLLERAKPVFTTLPGWKTDVRGCTEYSALPENAKAYVDFLEKEIETPIKLVSTGPGRHEVAYRK